MNKTTTFVVILLLLLSVIGVPTKTIAITDLPFNKTVVGSISEQKPRDAFTLTVEEAGILTVAANVYFTPAIIQLWGSNNDLIEYPEEIRGGHPENPATMNRDFHIEPGVYTLFIQNTEANVSGKYDVNVSFEPANNEEIEPNQTFTTAMPIQVNGKGMKGFLSANDRMDFYKAELKDPGRLYINVDSPYMMDGSISLYDDQGDSVIWGSLGIYPEVGFNRKLHADLEAGTYYIQIAGGQGVYGISLSHSLANNEEIEPNNDKATATPIKINDNKTHIGFLSHSDKVDYYKLDLKYDGYLTIEFSSEFINYALGNGGNRFYSSHLSNGAIGKPEKFVDKVKLKKGTYYFAARNVNIKRAGVYNMSFKSEPLFKDMTGRYTPAVTYLADREAAKGVSLTEFGIQHKIKRVDAAIWLANILELDTSDERPTPYVDVPERAWGAVNALKQEKIANGKSVNHFGANDTMTRGEMALLIQRAYKLSGEGVKHPFNDVSSRYEEAVRSLLKNNITQGKSADKFGTDAAITRGEMALFLYRAELN